MISSAQAQAISDQNEKIAEKQFKRMALTPVRLDKIGKRKRPARKRPEFRLDDSAKRPVAIVEVKSILSAGPVRDRKFLASTLDPEHFGKGPFSLNADFSDIDNALANAVVKYHDLVEDSPELARVPLVVVLFFDEFADHFNLYQPNMDRFPDVAGILKIESDHLIDAVAKTMSQEEVLARIESGSMAGMPRSTKRFRLLENTCAKRKLPRDFVAKCITAPAD